jgi:hypothetical protein
MQIKVICSSALKFTELVYFISDASFMHGNFGPCSPNKYMKGRFMAQDGYIFILHVLCESL